MRYNLSDYILSIKPTDSRINADFGTISVGGEGSTTSSITFNTSTNLFDTEGYATGGWVHNKNLDRTGTAVLVLNQLADVVSRLKRLCAVYYGEDYDGFTLALVDRNQQTVATAEDAYIQKIPEQAFGNEAADQSWTFTCGKITYA